jgi:transcriptional regulator with PAS, ATPase and Fis domain
MAITDPYSARAASLVGGSASIHALREVGKRIAAGDVKVLITGESGVGKDLVARYIHDHSARAQRPFVPVNCAAISETLLESELFGHVKGSFTGAYRDKPGRLQLADRGTVFLDELGETSTRMQALLLRFLETGEIHPVGSETIAATVNVRVIAATNSDLAAMVTSGQFREDLLYRIKVVHLHVPPLRERVDDIAPLIDHLVQRIGRPIRFTDAALTHLMAYRWPGNVRELHNVVEQVSWMASRDLIDVSDLPPAVRVAAMDPRPAGRERGRSDADDLFSGLISGRLSFWIDVYTPFLRRDLTRYDLRELVRLGLERVGGNYRALLPLFGMPAADYKRFLNFLAAHECTLDFRTFRTARISPVREDRSA